MLYLLCLTGGGKEAERAALTGSYFPAPFELRRDVRKFSRT